MPPRFGAGYLATTVLAFAICLAGPASSEPVFVDQGGHWSAALRADFYGVDQGSRMIPLAWLEALRQSDGKPFLDGALARYGYIPNGTGAELPIGFNVVDAPAGRVVGMTCAACHTRQMEVSGQTYRIDGGPAFADFGAFLSDLDAAVARTLADDTAFAGFAKDVLGPNVSVQGAAALKTAVTQWQTRDHAWAAGSLPRRPWGPARLDAISMIFNRLSGLDLGTSPDDLIVDNLQKADAPTRYPFLWNAPRQDFSQWAGFTENGNDELALARNLGELYGVFGVFHPHALPAAAASADRDFLSENSANFAGLSRAEALLRHLGPPIWPWPIDRALARTGAEVFNRPAADGGCAECHAPAPGLPRPPARDTLRTRIINVGTDTRQWQVLQRTVNTGSLAGAAITGELPPLRPRDAALGVLRLSVVGTLVQVRAAAASAHPHAENGQAATLAAPSRAALKGVMTMQATPARSRAQPRVAAQPMLGAYEARALPGIWAAAPYLHNGSVPSLADLLEPAAKRPHAFKLGPAYDLDKVGLAAEQPRSDVTLQTTGCNDRESGDSNCGHDYGTGLKAQEKKALLEYLKTL